VQNWIPVVEYTFYVDLMVVCCTCRKIQRMAIWWSWFCLISCIWFSIYWTDPLFSIGWLSV